MTLALEVSQLAPPPGWSRIALLAAVAIWALTVVALFRLDDVRMKRRV